MSTFDLCELKPPPEPSNPSPSFAKRIQELKWNSLAYQYYVDQCGNSSTIIQPVAQTSTTERSTLYNTTSTDFNGTTSVTNFPITSPTGLNTNNQLDSGTGSLDIGIILLIFFVILCLIAAAVIGVYILYRKYHKNKGSGSPQVYSLQTHEETNYVQNKVEKNQVWKGQTGNSNGETGNLGNGKTEDFVDEKVNYLHNKKVKGEVWKGNLDNLNGYHSNTKSECNGRRASGHDLPMKERPVAEPARVPDESKTNPTQDTEAIYINHQFEKLAKKSGQGNPSKEKTNKVKPAKTDTKYPPKEQSKIAAKFPPTDMETSEMFIIDENPYDKVDFKKPQQSKPVPTKRKTKQDADKP